jgi:hypothetical protein
MQINDPVMYHLSQSDKDSNAFRCGSVDFPVPATVTAVHDDGTVDIDVIESGGRTLSRQRVAATVMHEPGAGYVVSAKVHDEPEIQTDESGATIDQADPGTAQTVETKVYADGTTATGTAPLPDQSPAQQESSAESQPETEEGKAPEESAEA